LDLTGLDEVEQLQHAAGGEEGDLVAPVSCLSVGIVLVVFQRRGLLLAIEQLLAVVEQDLLGDGGARGDPASAAKEAGRFQASVHGLEPIGILRMRVGRPVFEIARVEDDPGSGHETISLRGRPRRRQPG
ncbi:MAG: hypothetical protein Q8R92_02920, partial [Deltaproteobacteria bacterium]|nr:hypothetical protein [Deltaproteobacteria bacterium]